MGNVNQMVFEKFQALYGPPKTENPDLFMDEYEKHLSGYADEILEKAVDLVVAEFAGTWGWPPIGMIREACKRVLPPPQQYQTFAPEADIERNPMVAARIAKLAKEAIQHIEEKREKPPESEAKYPNADDWMRMLAETPNHELHGINTEQQDAIREHYGLTPLSRRMTGEAAE